MEPVLTVTAIAAGVSSLFGLLFAAQVRARDIADAYRQELRERLRA